LPNIPKSVGRCQKFEALKYLHLGIITEIKRKSLPAICALVGLKMDKSCIILRDTHWDVKAFELRLSLIKVAIEINQLYCVLMKQETKKGHATDGSSKTIYW